MKRPQQTYVVDDAAVLVARAKLKAAKRAPEQASGHAWENDLPEADPLPEADDETMAILFPPVRRPRL